LAQSHEALPPPKTYRGKRAGSLPWDRPRRPTS
jgi:hypothetical protein